MERYRKFVLLVVCAVVALSAKMPVGAAGAGVDTATLKKITSRLDARTGVLAIEASDPVPYVASQPDAKTFVIELRDQRRIELARAIIASRGRLRHHVGGIIVKQRRPYNPAWSYHLDPARIQFYERSLPVHHALPSFVEAHLAGVGVKILPGSRWHPANSRLVREVR